MNRAALILSSSDVTEGETQERGIVGEMPNLAAQPQGLASPGILVISESLGSPPFCNIG